MSETTPAGVGRTVGGAVRLLIVATGRVSGRVFRDVAPDGVTFPYVTFTDPLSKAPSLVGDGVVAAYRRLVGVDVWQRVRSEDDALVRDLEMALDGARLQAGGGLTWGARLLSSQRVPDPDQLIVHHALTVAVNHDRATS